MIAVVPGRGVIGERQAEVVAVLRGEGPWRVERPSLARRVGFVDDRYARSAGAWTLVGRRRHVESPSLARRVGLLGGRFGKSARCGVRETKGAHYHLSQTRGHTILPVLKH
jgi:hypothetical protein